VSLNHAEASPLGLRRALAVVRQREKWFAGACIVAVLATASVPDAHARDPVQLSVLSYNIHGLPDAIAKADREKWMPSIARQSCRFNIVLIQEDFAYHEVLKKNAACHNQAFRGPGEGTTGGSQAMGFGVGNLSKLLTKGKLFGSGLTVFVSHKVTRNKGLLYGACEGYMSNQQDCFADKGVQLVTVRLDRGLVIDFYNTHLDSGASGADKSARAQQLNKLAAFIEANSRNRAVVVAGDFNLNWRAPESRRMLEGFISRLGLTRVAEAVDPKRPIDHILYRNGSRVALGVANAGVAEGFVSGGQAVSDHILVTVTFAVSLISRAR